MPGIKTNPTQIVHRPPLAELTATIQPVRKAATALKRRVGRFEIYNFLEVIYRVYFDWKQRKIAKRSARLLADELSIAPRKGTSPIRVLIEASLPGVDPRQKSRWVRALEYIYAEGVPPPRFRKFVRARGGVAGCARLAVNVNRKRRRPGGDSWND
jgi:hypothetical protein